MNISKQFPNIERVPRRVVYSMFSRYSTQKLAQQVKDAEKRLAIRRKMTSFVYVVSMVCFLFLLGGKNLAADTVADITVYKSPTCGCCGKWVAHLQDAGLKVRVKDQTKMASIKRKFGINPKYQSCHTASVLGYFVEGHVPAKEIKRLVEERPDIKGLSVPGMPMGSPGMEGGRVDSYSVLAVEHDSSINIFSRY